MMTLYYLVHVKKIPILSIKTYDIIYGNNMYGRHTTSLSKHYTLTDSAVSLRCLSRSLESCCSSKSMGTSA